MEPITPPKYFCPKAGCNILYQKRSDHPSHANSLQKIPTQLQNFRFEEKIGQGAMGAVFKVHDTLDREQKALKLISINDSALLDGDINNLKKLHHQYIIHYYGSGSIGDEYYWVLMELCDSDLEQAIQQKRFSSFEQKVEVFKQICKGIQYFHKVRQ